MKKILLSLGILLIGCSTQESPNILVDSNTQTESSLFTSKILQELDPEPKSRTLYSVTTSSDQEETFHIDFFSDQGPAFPNSTDSFYEVSYGVGNVFDPEKSTLIKDPHFLATVIYDTNMHAVFISFMDQSHILGEDLNIIIQEEGEYMVAQKILNLIEKNAPKVISEEGNFISPLENKGDPRNFEYMFELNKQ